MKSRCAGFGTVSLVVLACGIVPALAQAATLDVGDPAPPLSVSQWVKGDKIEKFEPGQIYVVEFWATWCGPCKVSIPHLTELQKKYKDRATFIGVSVFEQDQSEVAPFVKEMGDKMDYAVALDDVGQGKGPDGKMAQAWMEASEEEGIPTAFIVQKNGRIAWIGHPMSMDKPLEQIVQGTWDIQAAASERKEAKARQKKMQALAASILGPAREKDFDKAVAVIDKAVQEDPKLEENLAGMKLMLLSQADKPKELLEYSSKVVDGVFKDNGLILNQVAWILIDPQKKATPSPEAVAVALKAAKRADELTEHKNGAILDTLALATFLSGDAAHAAELQDLAVKLLGDNADDETKARLEKYRKAAGSKE